jgi:hypothetical protein
MGAKDSRLARSSCWCLKSCTTSASSWTVSTIPGVPLGGGANGDDVDDDSGDSFRLAELYNSSLSLFVFLHGTIHLEIKAKASAAAAPQRKHGGNKTMELLVARTSGSSEKKEKRSGSRRRRSCRLVLLLLLFISTNKCSDGVGGSGTLMRSQDGKKQSALNNCWFHCWFPRLFSPWSQCHTVAEKF